MLGREDACLQCSVSEWINRSLSDKGLHCVVDFVRWFCWTRPQALARRAADYQSRVIVSHDMGQQTPNNRILQRDYRVILTGCPD